MKRANKYSNVERVDAIWSADWHLRDNDPPCRNDNFQTAQWDKVRQVRELQEKWGCPVYHIGDLYNHWKPSPYLLSKTMQELPKGFVTVYGQHDLPFHSWEYRNKSGIYALEQAEFLTALVQGGWQQDPVKIRRINSSGKRSVGLSHRFIWDGDNIPWPGCDELTAKQMLKKYPKFDLIVTGDHHRPFVYTNKKGRTLLNCGCLTRQDASYINHKPRVWVWNAISNKITPYFLKYDEGAVDPTVNKTKERDIMIKSFISRISEEWELSMSFEKNLERFFSKHKTGKSVMKLIYKSLKNEK